MWIGYRLLYGLLTGNIFPLVVTFLFGEVMATIYTAIYYRWTSEKALVAKIVRRVAVILSLATLYAVLAALGKTNQTKAQAGKCVGYIGVCASFILYLSPFESIMQVLATKSGESIPINMCVAGTVSNAIWVAYAALTHDVFMLIPNAVCMLLASIQVTLYWVFRPKSYSSSKLLYSKTLQSSDEDDDDPTSTSSGDDGSPTAVRFGSPSGDYMAIVISD